MKKIILIIFSIVFMAALAYAEKIDYTISPIQCNANTCTPFTFNSSDGKYFFNQSISPYRLICTDKCQYTSDSKVSSKTNTTCPNKIDCLEYTKYYYTPEQLIKIRDNFERNCLINISKQKAIITIDPNKFNQVTIPEKKSSIDNGLISWIQFLMDLLTNKIKIIS